MALLGMIERLTENGRYFGMETNMVKFKVLRVSSQPSPIQIMVDQKQPENVEFFRYLSSTITNDASIKFKTNLLYNVFIC